MLSLPVLRGFLVLITVFALVAPAISEDLGQPSVVVHLKDGSRVKGALQETSGTQVILETVHGTLTISQMEIESIEFEQRGENEPTDELDTPPIVQVNVRDTTKSSEPPRSVARFAIHAGVGLPSAPDLFGDWWSAGFGGGGAIGFQISPVAQFLVSGSITRFGFDEEAFLLDAGLNSGVLTFDGGAIAVITGFGEIRLQVPTSGATPFFSGGLGVFRLSASDLQISGPGGAESVNFPSETALGVSLGAGIRVPLAGGKAVLLHVPYVIGMTDGESTQLVELRVGLEFGS